MIPKRRLQNISIAGRPGAPEQEQTETIHECSLDEVVLDVEQAVDAIASDYLRMQGFILSEDDLKCALYHKLYPMYSQPVPTFDSHISATALHTEIPWYNESDLLTLRPDLSIIDPRRLSILHGIGEHPRRNAAQHFRLPSKGFEFGGQAVAIETKFVRALSGISQRHIVSFQKDIDKMQRLCVRHNQDTRTPNVKGVLVVFSKTRKGSEKIDELKTRNSALSDIKIIYHSAGVVNSQHARRR